jgi:deoxyguanosine kinase
MLYNYVCIEGLIGVGKTTTVKYLAEELGAQCLLEKFEENIVLPNFYKDKEKHALQVESFFLEQRFKQIRDTDFSKKTIADYCFDKCLVFGKTTLSVELNETHKQLFDERKKQLVMPDIVIYLLTKVESALKNISTRSREYEKNIESTYLNSLQAEYLLHFQKIKEFPVIIFDIRSLDLSEYNTLYSKLKETLSLKHPLGISHIVL